VSLAPAFLDTSPRARLTLAIGRADGPSCSLIVGQSVHLWRSGTTVAQ